MKVLKRLAALALAAVALTGCMQQSPGQGWTLAEDVPAIPEKLRRGDGAPTLKVYDAARGEAAEMDVETYVAGVVAGEMKNDWPLEALKAQAILARTFTLKFCQDKKSKHAGADISTDVKEAQAYAAESVNDRVRQAVKETRGMAMAYRGEYPYAWFHAHAGGMTELPSVSLDFNGDDPAYLQPVASKESVRAPENVRRWTASFTKDEVKKACADAGAKVDAVESVEAGERGASGRIKTLVVDGRPVSAASFRIQIGANRLKSTLIDEISINGDRVVFKGRGFGHGVGLSQWGAYAMAEGGSDAEAIIRHYFRGVGIVKLW